MPIDDPRFEDYLKQFRPLPPKELVLDDSRRTPIRPQSWWVWACAAAAVVIAALLADVRTRVAVVDGTLLKDCCAAPFTVRGANANLFGAASTKDALDQMTFPKQPALPKGQHSALLLLGQEKAEL